jgi:hypothetical protein
MSDKALVRQIRINAMLTSDRVKPELLCPRWLPRWMVGYQLPLYSTGCRPHSSMGGANGYHRGAYGWRVGPVRQGEGARTPRRAACMLGTGGAHAWSGRCKPSGGRARLRGAHT